MRTLVFDGRMGASGDMILAALLAAGADPGVLDPVESALDVAYRIGEAEKNGIAATRVDVVVDDNHDEGDETTDDQSHDPQKERGHGHNDGHEHDHSHGHDHEHEHGHDDDHEHDHGHGHNDGHEHDHSHGHDHEHEHGHDDDHGHPPDHAEGRGPHRSYGAVVGIVEDMGLPERVESDARAIFELLAEAEAAVHGTDLDATRFHEVGADDAIADIAGAALLLDDLDPDRVVTTPLATGGGVVSMSHGTYPVPAPAVVEIAERADWSLRGGPVESELLTPTGAAILAHHAEGVDSLPPLYVEASGYGAGGYDFPEHPNVLRATVGEGKGGLRREEVAVLETNLDDATPETLGGLQQTLAAVGALDVSIVPTTMKKSRPGHLVTVVAKPEDERRVARRLAEETGTLGVRTAGARHRWVADRAIETAPIEVGESAFEVAVKVASAGGEVYDVSAEFDDALAVAEETGRPVREIMRRAEAAVRGPDDAG